MCQTDCKTFWHYLNLCVPPNPKIWGKCASTKGFNSHCPVKSSFPFLSFRTLMPLFAATKSNFLFPTSCFPFSMCSHSRHPCLFLYGICQHAPRCRVSGDKQQLWRRRLPGTFTPHFQSLFPAQLRFTLHLSISISNDNLTNQGWNSPSRETRICRDLRGKWKSLRTPIRYRAHLSCPEHTKSFFFYFMSDGATFVIVPPWKGVSGKVSEFGVGNGDTSCAQNTSSMFLGSCPSFPVFITQETRTGLHHPAWCVWAFFVCVLPCRISSLLIETLSHTMVATLNEHVIRLSAPPPFLELAKVEFCIFHASTFLHQKQLFQSNDPSTTQRQTQAVSHWNGRILQWFLSSKVKRKLIGTLIKRRLSKDLFSIRMEDFRMLIVFFFFFFSSNCKREVSLNQIPNKHGISSPTEVVSISESLSSAIAEKILVWRKSEIYVTMFVSCLSAYNSV